ncbi:HAD family hydrolase [Bifidobacterium biavatii]|uniref:Phosphatase n=1 Tax=Bifidobacterium biavatii DSM 23969 TaxID=1437608 RepID=A0A087A1D1_9BIFI|nr:HAD family hydrolase [Bifidobacterium biavatii]KFI52581.1 phosphatase [Bifidobacterium biavatii DSM 23969]
MRAVLWDLDGTLVDSDPMWVAAERRCAERHGVTWSDGLSRRLTAAPLPVCARVLREAGVNETDDRIIDSLIADVTRQYDLFPDSVPWTPGAWDLMTALVREGIPSVLVTGSPRSLAERVVVAAPVGTFVGIVSGDDALAHKPDPAPYAAGVRVAGEWLGRQAGNQQQAGQRQRTSAEIQSGYRLPDALSPGECLAFEDSASGIASARAAGVRVIGVNACARVPLDPTAVGCPVVSDLRALDPLSSATPR